MLVLMNFMNNTSRLRLAKTLGKTVSMNKIVLLACPKEDFGFNEMLSAYNIQNQEVVIHSINSRNKLSHEAILDIRKPRENFQNIEIVAAGWVCVIF